MPNQQLIKLMMLNICFADHRANVTSEPMTIGNQLSEPLHEVNNLTDGLLLGTSIISDLSTHKLM